MKIFLLKLIGTIFVLWTMALMMVLVLPVLTSSITYWSFLQVSLLVIGCTLVISLQLFALYIIWFPNNFESNF